MVPKNSLGDARKEIDWSGESSDALYRNIGKWVRRDT
jgi:hypothetical protein